MRASRSSKRGQWSYIFYTFLIAFITGLAVFDQLFQTVFAVTVRSYSGFLWHGILGFALARFFLITWKTFLIFGMMLYKPDDPEIINLHDTVARGDMAQVEILLKSGIDVNAPGPIVEGSRTALHVAVALKNAEMVRFILHYSGTEIDSKDIFGVTPLVRAVENCDQRIVKLLIETGADVNARDYFGDTVLILSVTRHHDSIADLLIEAGADPFLADSRGTNAYGWAEIVAKRNFLEACLQRKALSDGLGHQVETSESSLKRYL